MHHLRVDLDVPGDVRDLLAAREQSMNEWSLGREAEPGGGGGPRTHPPAELTRQVLRAEARVALEAFQTRGSVHTLAVFTHVRLQLAVLAAVPGLAHAREPPRKAAAVSVETRVGDAAVGGLLAGGAGPLGGAAAAVQVEQVLAHTLVLAGVGGAHAGPPAAAPGGRGTVQQGERLLLRSGQLQLCVPVERKRNSSNLHRPQTTGEGRPSLCALPPHEDVCSPLQKLQPSRC